MERSLDEKENMVPSSFPFELIEEREDDGIERGEDNVDDENDDTCEKDSETEDDNSSSSYSYERTNRPKKRFKEMTEDENSFKYKVMNILKESCKVAGDYAVSGKIESTPLVAISIKNGADGAVDECIKFPLQESEVHKIIKFFEPSPYGKDAETLVGATVQNSFQLSPDGFEILNSDWDKFIKTVLVNRIKKEMSLECSFVPSLYKLLLYTSGSFFKSNRDSEKEDNMFGTLLVQLPSTYKGGQLVVRHDGKTKIFDCSSNGVANNSFNTFFSAFYCDCEHEILPVTDGYRLCLVYNLIATDVEVPIAPQNSALEMELVTLLKNWKDARKVVYALTHKYSEASLSFKNLKTTDKIIANILKRVSNVCDLNIFLSFLEKDCSGGDADDNGEYNCRGCASHFDGDFEDVSYTLRTLISDVDNEKFAFSGLNVDFDEEVIPIDCFESKKPFEQDCEHTGYDGVQISKSYRCAAITFWPKELTFQVLKTSGAPPSLIDTFFLKAAEKYFDDDCDAEAKAKILEWAKLVVAQRRYTWGKPIVKTILKFNDMELIKMLITNGMASSPQTFPLIVEECDKHGWEHFSTVTVEMFKQLSQNTAIKNLISFFGNGNLNQEKNQVFFDLLQGTFDNEGNQRIYSTAAKLTQQKEDKDLLEQLVKVVLQFNDLSLMQKLVNCILPLHSETISVLATICERFGWEPFVTSITDKFKQLSKKLEVMCLTSLIQNGILTDDKKALCRNLFKVMFEKNEELISEWRYHCSRTALSTETSQKELLEPLINAAAIFNELELMKTIFQQMVPLHAETIPILISQCEIHGWNAFATEIENMFAKLSQIDAIDAFSLLIGSGSFKEEKILSFNLFLTILGKTHPPPTNYNSPLTQHQKSKYLKEKQDILYSICRVAENIKFSLTTFAKKQPFKDFVPVLLRLVQKDTNRLTPYWAAIAFHFIAELGRESIREIENSWRHSTTPFSVCCNDCVLLLNFLRSDREQESFRIGEKRRKHLQKRANLIEKLSHRNEIIGRGQVGVLILIKTEMGGAEAIEDQKLSKILLEKLRSVMPYN